jgi:chromosome segregation ATPase
LADAHWALGLGGLLSADIRDSLEDVPRLVAEVERLRGEVAFTQGQRDAEEDIREMAEAEVERLRADAVRRQERLEGWSLRCQAADAHVDELRGVVEDWRTAADTQADRAHKAEAEVERLRAQVERVEGELAAWDDVAATSAVRAALDGP